MTSLARGHGMGQPAAPQHLGGSKFSGTFELLTFKTKYASFRTHAWRQILFQLKHGIRFRRERMQLRYRNLISADSASYNGIMTIME